MFIIIFTIMILGFLFINRKIFKNFLNFSNLFLLMYYIVIMFSMTGLYGFEVESNKLYLLLFISLCSFEIFSILFSIIKIPIKEETSKKIINKRRMNIIALIVFILMIPTTLKGIEILINYGFKSVRTAAFSTEVYSTPTKLLLYYILSPLSKAILMYSVLEYIKSKKISFSLIIGIANMIQMLITFGGRSVLVELMLMIIVCVIGKYNRNLFKIVKQNKKIIIIALIMILIIQMVTSDRSLNSNEGLFFNLYSYYVGSIHLMDYHLNHTNISLLDNDHLLYGQGIISPIVEIFKLVTQTLGFDFDIVTGLEKGNECIQLFIELNNGVIMNNNVTFLYVCLRDFGNLGLIIDVAYIALWFSILYKMYKKKKCIMTDALYFYLISNMPYFIFGFTLDKTAMILTFIYIVFIYKIAYKKEKSYEKHIS